MTRARTSAALLGLLLLLFVAAVIWLNLRGDEASSAPLTAATDAATIARGA